MTEKEWNPMISKQEVVDALEELCFESDDHRIPNLFGGTEVWCLDLRKFNDKLDLVEKE